MLLLPSVFLKQADLYPIIDVRTPAEFALGHIPGAINIPLFTNEERAVVGTIYKQKGKEAAVEKGLEYVGPQMINYIKRAKAVAVEGKVLVHCWRGGMRSSSMAWLFRTAGLQADTLLGGYKAYRNFNKQLIEKSKQVIVLGGYTGSGKSHILRELNALGEQFVDLERIAHHKGSAFGHIGETQQPTNEQFENEVAAVWRKLNLDKTIWLEDESKAIGHVFQPDILYNRIRNSKLIFLNIPKDIRVNRLVADYTVEDKEALAGALAKIVKRLGGDNYRKAIEALDINDFATVADISLNYYDKAYGYGVSQRNQNQVVTFQTNETDIKKTAILVREFARGLEQ